VLETCSKQNYTDEKVNPRRKQAPKRFDTKTWRTVHSYPTPQATATLSSDSAKRETCHFWLDHHWWSRPANKAWHSV